MECVENNGHGRKACVLIVDDEKDIRSLLADILTDEGYETLTASSAEEFNKISASLVPDLVILDIWLEGSQEDGIALLKKFKKKEAETPVIMISGHGTIETAVESIKYGAYDFIEKPFKSDRLLLLVHHALETRALKAENRGLKSHIEGGGEIVGGSPAICALKSTLERVAPTNSRVLIQGEAGTGKDLVARMVHYFSQRAARPFMALNCAVLTPAGLEKELFGSEGAEEGIAKSPVRGVLENATGGTLYLDQVGDMPLETQGKIIRVIQDQIFHRVGGSEEIQVDVRIIASTSFDLVEAMQKGRFREDLYYRLNVVPIHIPPLQERAGDIMPLCRHFIARYAKENGMPERVIGNAAAVALERYTWPGNVRQVKNVMEWLMIMLSTPYDQEVEPHQLPAEIIQDERAGDSGRKEEKIGIASWDMVTLPLKEARERFERTYLQTQIARFGGNVSKTAAFVGMERSALHRKIKTLKLGDHENSAAKSEVDEEKQPLTRKKI